MGDFDFENPPLRSGSYVRWRTKQAETLPVSTGSIAAVPFTHDWGPVKEPVLVQSFAEFVEIFGRGEVSYTKGFLAVYNAFKGEGPSIAPGAGAVLCYRMAGASAAPARKILNNTTPAAGLRLSARYPGSFGNSLSAAVMPNVKQPATMKDLVILKGSNELERFKFANTAIQALADNINANSGWVTADQVVDGVALADLAATSLTAGDDGNTLLAADYTDAQDKLVSQRYSIFAPADLTDASIVTSLSTWTSDLNARQKSKRFGLAIGGALNEDYDSAETRSAGIDNENIYNWGVGSYRDRSLTANDPRGEVMSTAQLAPRLAGIILQRGIASAISFAQLEDLEIVSGPTDDDILDAIENGVITVGLGPSGVRFERGVTTLTTDTPEKPLETWSVLKYAHTAQGLERDINELNENGNIVGKLGVNNDTREHLVSEARGILTDYITRGGIQKLRAGEGIGVASDPPPDDDQSFVALEWRARFGRALEQVRNTMYVS